jgi:hypothetical protein
LAGEAVASASAATAATAINVLFIALSPEILG